MDLVDRVGIIILIYNMGVGRLKDQKMATFIKFGLIVDTNQALLRLPWPGLSLEKTFQILMIEFLFILFYCFSIAKTTIE